MGRLKGITVGNSTDEVRAIQRPHELSKRAIHTDGLGSRSHHRSSLRGRQAVARQETDPYSYWEET